MKNAGLVKVCSYELETFPMPEDMLCKRVWLLHYYMSVVSSLSWSWQGMHACTLKYSNSCYYSLCPSLEIRLISGNFFVNCRNKLHSFFFLAIELIIQNKFSFYPIAHYKSLLKFEITHTVCTCKPTCSILRSLLVYTFPDQQFYLQSQTSTCTMTYLCIWICGVFLQI